MRPRFTYHKPKIDRSSGRDGGYLLLAIIVAMVAATAVFAAIQLRTNEVAEWLQKGNQMVGFVVISDPVHRVSFEVMIIDPITRRAALFFVPGNVAVLVPSRNRMDALESVYHQGSISLVYDKFEELLGVKPLFYLDVTDSRLRDFIDLIGGVEVVVESVERDKGGNSYSNLPVGMTNLDGDKANALLGHLSTDESHLEWAARVHRIQRGIIAALGKQRQMIRKQTVQRYLFGSVGTDLTSTGLAMMFDTIAQLDSESLNFQYTIGQPQVVDGRTLVFPHYDGDLLRESFAYIMTTLASEFPHIATVNVEVLNGTSIPGLARKAAPLLQSFGHKVLRIANADRDDYPATLVVDQQESPEIAGRIASLIGCSQTKEEWVFSTNSEVDVTIILGGDFNGRQCTS